jgi:putative DNA primase/helicase
MDAEARVLALAKGAGERSENPIDHVLSRFDHPKKTTNGWDVRCPAHPDAHPSLGIREEPDGKVLVNCRTGCHPDAVLSAAGLTASDLFRSKTSTPRTETKRIEYQIRAIDGSLVTTHVRIDYNDGSKTYRWKTGESWTLNGAPSSTLPLYGSEYLPKTPGRIVVVTEGEKAAAAARNLKLFGLGTVGGASSLPTTEVLESLRGRDVVLWPDNDEPGRRHMRAIGQRLEGIAQSVRVVTWGSQIGDDAADFLARGGTEESASELIAAAVPWNEYAAGPVASAPEWEPPRPLDSVNLPVFPVSTLPSVLADFVAAEAESTQTPLDLAGLLALAVVGAACSKVAEVEVKPGWREPLNLFTVVALPPGSRKSAVFSDVTRPFVTFERERAKELGPEIARAQERRLIKEATLARLRTEAAKATPEEQAGRVHEAEALAVELSETMIPTLPRLVVDDISPEKLPGLLMGNGGRLAVMAPEGDVFETMAGRYSSNGDANFGAFLRGHAGDPIRVDRVKREPEFVARPALTVALAVQPGVIRGLQSKAGFRDRGLLARFLYGLPESTVGRRTIDAAPVPAETASRYEATIRALLNLKPGDEPYVLKLSTEARGALRDFELWLEPQLAQDGELGALGDWGAKLAGAVVRLAGIRHMAERATEAQPWTVPISGSTMAAAMYLAEEYLIQHAKAAFGAMGSDETIEDARTILTWIRRKAEPNFTKRNAFDSLRGQRFKKAEDIDAGLSALEGHEYVRAREVRSGGRPSIVYDVNPAVIGN